LHFFLDRTFEAEFTICIEIKQRPPVLDYQKLDDVITSANNISIVIQDTSAVAMVIHDSILCGIPDNSLWYI
jgi:hypothetical protein